MSTSSTDAVKLEKDADMQVDGAPASAELKVGNEASTTPATEATLPPTATKPVPEGFIVHTESTTSILFAAPPQSTSEGPAPVFLNPVQEYNRDLSVVAIRTWGDVWAREKRGKWEEGVRKKWERNKGKEGKGKGGKGKKRAAEGEVEEKEGEGKRVKTEDGEAVVKQEAKEEEVQEEKPSVADSASAPASPSAPTDPTPSTSSSSAPPASTSAPTATTEPEFSLPRVPTYKFSLLEALSATGLRAIRYAKELPLLKYVIANDLSASAVLDIKRNIAYNDLSPLGVETLPGYVEGMEIKPGGKWSKAAIEEARDGKVRVNEGDACVYMYQHRAEPDRFDCIDLDPYGSAVPFLDAAMNAIQDGGLMCVTCTDVGVLAGHNYPEKAFSAYGGLCANAEYSHEVGLRLVLHSLATTAARYGRYIEPQLSLSIDFYVRVFVRVYTGPKEVKALASKTSLVYYCHSCQSPHFQPLGRVSEKPSAKDPKNVNTSYHIPQGPPKGMGDSERGDRCGECGGAFHIAGPLWSAPIHNKAFVSEMLEHIEENADSFKTSERIKGMLTVAKSEVETPLYFSPAKMASLFHATCPTIQTVGSALLNAGYQISRSHAVAGSIKTDAPRKFVHDIIREWIKANPVAMKNVKEGSPARRLLAGEQTHTVSLAPHPDVATRLLDNVKLVRYQMNPQANWGPARAAVRGAPKN